MNPRAPSGVALEVKGKEGRRKGKENTSLVYVWKWGGKEKRKKK